MKRTILIVDDDPKTVQLIRLYLEKDEYHVLEAYDGRQALDLARHAQPDLIILDLMLPRIDGLDVCRIIRGESRIPVIMLTARSTEDDKLAGLELGADDYITKPFSPRELIARVRTVLRRASEQESNLPTHIAVGDLVVDFTRRSVSVQGREVHLTRREFRLLQIMVCQPERVFSRQDLLEGSFGSDFGGLERTVDVHIMNLRKKIEPDPDHPIYIRTVYGIGYKIVEQPDAK